MKPPFRFADGIRIAACVFGFACFGTFAGVIGQQTYLAAIGPDGVAHVPRGNSRALYLLGPFILGGWILGGVAGGGYGAYEFLRNQKRRASTSPAETESNA